MDVSQLATSLSSSVVAKTQKATNDGLNAVVVFIDVQKCHTNYWRVWAFVGSFLRAGI